MHRHLFYHLHTEYGLELLIFNSQSALDWWFNLNIIKKTNMPSDPEKDGPLMQHGFTNPVGNNTVCKLVSWNVVK